MEGKIKWYKKEKGYGFLLGDDGKDYFVHYTSLPQGQEDVRESDNIKVTFDVTEGRDGREQSANVVIVGKEESSDEESDESEE